MIVGGWLVAVALAVLVGVVGINLVGSGLTDPQAAPMSEEQVERELAAPAPVPPSSPAGSPPSAAPASATPASSVASAPPAGRSFTTAAGLVVADCTRILSMAPAQGWAVAEQDDDEGEFRSVDNPAAGLEVDLTCSGGQPSISVSPAD